MSDQPAERPFGRLPLKTDGPITTALKAGIELRAKLIADGTPEHEADHIVGQGLKAVMGNPRNQAWRFYCERCRDTGMMEVVPDLERMTKLYGPNPQMQPTYRPCEPCLWRTREREKRRKAAGEPDQDFAAAGHMKPRKKF